MLITYLPYADFSESAKCLSDKDLLQQLQDNKVIFTTLVFKEQKNYLHTGTFANSTDPCILMWQGYLPAFINYYNICLLTALQRQITTCTNLIPLGNYCTLKVKEPQWLRDDKLHHSHQYHLYKCNYLFYAKYDDIWDFTEKDSELVFPAPIRN